MAESIHEQIAVALKTGFAAIVGDQGATYWHTPNLVARVHHFEDAHLEKARGDVVYLLQAGDETHEEITTNERLMGRAEFFLLVAKRYAPANENAGSLDGEGRQTIVNQLVRDAIRALTRDVTLSGQTINVIDQEPLSVDRSMVFTGWALAQLHFLVGYPYHSVAP